MMNLKHCLFLAIGATILAASCTKPDDKEQPKPITKPPVDTTDTNGTVKRNFSLLKLGNYWLYDVQVYSIAGFDTNPKAKAARVEIKPQTHLASDEYYFDLSAKIQGIPVPQLAERFVCREKVNRMESSRDLDSTVRQTTYAEVVHKPLTLGETWFNDSLTVKVTKVNQQITVPVGTFICNKLEMQAKKSRERYVYYFDTAFKYFAPLIEYWDTAGTKVLYRLKMAEKNN